MQSIVGRKRSYSGSQVGFKIDLRLLLDSREGDHDLLALEAVKEGSSSKLCYDVCKLMRESKDNIDASLLHILQRCMRIPLLFWYMQTNGVDAHVGNVQLSCPGVYVALHECTVHFPRDISSLQAFKGGLIKLISVVFDLERTAMMIKKSMDSIN